MITRRRLDRYKAELGEIFLRLEQYVDCHRQDDAIWCFPSRYAVMPVPVELFSDFQIEDLRLLREKGDSIETWRQIEVRFRKRQTFLSRVRRIPATFMEFVREIWLGGCEGLEFLLNRNRVPGGIYFYLGVCMAAGLIGIHAGSAILAGFAIATLVVAVYILVTCCLYGLFTAIKCFPHPSRSSLPLSWFEQIPENH